MPERDLSSWKEIAEFPGVTVRTAQLWEKQRGLPVRRVPGGQRGGVRASVDELRVWQAGLAQAPERAAAPAGKVVPSGCCSGWRLAWWTPEDGWQDHAVPVSSPFNTR